MVQPSSEQYRLLVQLLQSSWLTTYGGRVERSLSGPVIVYYQGRHLGSWWYEGDGFHFAPSPGQPAELTARTAQEAVALTLVRVMRSAAGRRAVFARGYPYYSAASLPNCNSDKRA